MVLWWPEAAPLRLATASGTHKTSFWHAQDHECCGGRTGVSRNRAFAALEKNDGDIDRALVELQPQAPRRDKGVGRKAGKRGGRR